MIEDACGVAPPHPGKFSHGGLPQRRGNSFQQDPVPLGKRSKTIMRGILWTPFGRHCTSFGRPWEAFWTPGRPCGPRTVKKDSALICAMTRRLPELQTNFFRELILTPVARVSMTLSLFWRSVFWHFFSYPICTLFLVLDSIWETIWHAFWRVRELWKSS